MQQVCELSDRELIKNLTIIFCHFTNELTDDENGQIPKKWY